MKPFFANLEKANLASSNLANAKLEIAHESQTFSLSLIQGCLSPIGFGRAVPMQTPEPFS